MRQILLTRRIGRARSALLLASLGLLALSPSRAADAPPDASAAAQAAAVPDAQARQVFGNWLTQDRDGIIQLSLAADGTYQARIVGGHDPQRLDVNNPDPALRHEPLRGHIIMQGMKYNGAGRWSGGTIRDPDNGRLYQCRLQLLDPGHLQLRGFIGFSLLGRSQVWTRYNGSSMDLPEPASK